jgi:hypothetical protein
MFLIMIIVFKYTCFTIYKVLTWKKRNLQIAKPNLTSCIFHTLYNLERKNLNIGKSTCYKDNTGAIMLIRAKVVVTIV